MPVIFCELGFGSCLYGYWLLLLTNAICFIVNDLVKSFKHFYLLVLALNRYYLVATDYAGSSQKLENKKHTHTPKKKNQNANEIFRAVVRLFLLSTASHDLLRSHRAVEKRIARLR